MSGTLAQQNNSKASTVELAIDYIKSLQKELSETKEKLQAAEGHNMVGKEKEKEKEKDKEKEIEKEQEKEKEHSEPKGDMDIEAT